MSISHFLNVIYELLLLIIIHNFIKKNNDISDYRERKKSNKKQKFTSAK